MKKTVFFLGRAFYMPGRKGDRVIWLTQHKAKIATHGPTLGLTPAEVTERQNSCQNIIDEVNTSAQMKQALENQYAHERQVTKTELDLIFKGVDHDKADPNWTEGIGQDLGEIGDDITIDWHAQKPVLKLTKTTEGWRIEFDLKGHFTSVLIERMRPGGNWEFLVEDHSNPAMDTDVPQVNGTKYRAVYKEGDMKMDSWSDEVTVEV